MLLNYTLYRSTILYSYTLCSTVTIVHENGTTDASLAYESAKDPSLPDPGPPRNAMLRQHSTLTIRYDVHRAPDGGELQVIAG